MQSTDYAVPLSPTSFRERHDHRAAWQGNAITVRGAVLKAAGVASPVVTRRSFAQ